MTGSFVVETVFSSRWAGSSSNRESADQTMILGVVMIYSAMLLALNWWWTSATRSLTPHPGWDE
jgi:hypothetical protein